MRVTRARVVVTEAVRSWTKCNSPVVASQYADPWNGSGAVPSLVRARWVGQFSGFPPILVPQCFPKGLAVTPLPHSSRIVLVYTCLS